MTNGFIEVETEKGPRVISFYSIGWIEPDPHNPDKTVIWTNIPAGIGLMSFAVNKPYQKVIEALPRTPLK